MDRVDSFQFLLKPDEITGSWIYLIEKEKKCRHGLTREHLERFLTNVSICIFRNGYFCFVEIFEEHSLKMNALWILIRFEILEKDGQMIDFSRFQFAMLSNIKRGIKDD